MWCWEHFLRWTLQELASYEAVRNKKLRRNNHVKISGFINQWSNLSTFKNLENFGVITSFVIYHLDSSHSLFLLFRHFRPYKLFYVSRIHFLAFTTLFPYSNNNSFETFFRHFSRLYKLRRFCERWKTKHISIPSFFQHFFSILFASIFYKHV